MTNAAYFTEPAWILHRRIRAAATHPGPRHMKPTIQQRDYLFQTDFRVMGTEVYQFVSRAYRDLNRTLRGIS